MTQKPFHLPGPVIEIAGGTDRGLVRPSNEDSYLVLQGQAIPSWCSAVAAVFDGVGGLSQGGEASARTAKYTAESLRDPSSQRRPRRGPGKMLEDLMRVLHQRLKADGQHASVLQGMATTATVAILVPTSRPTLWLGYVGDSPAFRVRDGQMEKLVMEDSLVAGLLREGLISPEQAKHHPQRHVITQALGLSEEVTPHVSAHQVQPGDRFLLCTDGLTNLVTEEHILEILVDEPPRSACSKLVDAANAAGGTDNITVVVMKF